jgi:GT2 family glycosyltransferase
MERAQPTSGPDATVAIVTKDRRDELRQALESALSQDGAIEILVVDDGSTDGTAEMVRAEYPRVRVERFDSSAGLVVRRNEAARLARARVIVSIDDDAVFSGTGTVAQTLRDFDHPRIGVVAIPYIDVRSGSGENQRAPYASGCWVTATFRGTAYAVRRDLFLALGGFRETIFHQGEEADFSLRMLAAGFLVRLGRGDPIHHFESPKRDFERMVVYEYRNLLLLGFSRFPFPWNVGMMAGHALRGIVQEGRRGQLKPTLRGIWLGLRACWALRRERCPLPHRTVWLDRRLRLARAVPLEALEGNLPARPT